MGSQAGSKQSLPPPPLLPEFGAAGAEFADRISQLLAKESTSVRPNWIEHTKVLWFPDQDGKQKA